jgi:hypothetical protein
LECLTIYRPLAVHVVDRSIDGLGQLFAIQINHLAGCKTKPKTVASKRREGIDQAAFDFVSQDDPTRPGYLRLSEDIRASLFDLCDCETRRNGVTRVGQGVLTSLERKRDTEICPRTNVASLPDGIDERLPAREACPLPCT